MNLQRSVGQAEPDNSAHQPFAGWHITLDSITNAAMKSKHAGTPPREPVCQAEPAKLGYQGLLRNMFLPRGIRSMQPMRLVFIFAIWSAVTFCSAGSRAAPPDQKTLVVRIEQL